MNDKLIFFVSAYLLFALFLTIHIFTSNILAEAISGFFGIILVANISYTYKESIKEFFIALQSYCTRLVKHIYVR